MKRGYLSLLKQYGWLTLLSGALLAALLLMSQILQNASEFEQMYGPLLIFTFSGIFILLIVLLRTLYKLYKGYRKNQAGIRLTLKLTTYITLLVGVPVSIIFLFALSFIHQGIDQWFDVKTEKALNEAIKLVQANLDDKTRDKLKQAQNMVVEKRWELLQNPAQTVNTLRTNLNAQLVALYRSNGQLVAFSSQNTNNIAPPKPDDNLFQQVRQNLPYATLKSLPGFSSAHSFIEIMLPVSGKTPQQNYALHAQFSIPDNLIALAHTVQLAATQYNELSYLRQPLKTSFTLILTLLMLLTIVTAILFTIQVIQNLTRPIRALERGTRAVAKGDYSVTIPQSGEDEFGKLIHSFNDMIQKISRARNDLKYSHQQTEVQKLYLQAIIKNLSSGVLTLDPQRRLRTVNRKLDEILNIESHQHIGKPLEDIVLNKQSTHLAPLFAQIEFLFEAHPEAWHQQLQFNCKQGEKTLLIHGSTLPSLDQQTGGYVVVIDDVTELVQAQRHAAWSDVARRLAHEIKNPLTPIQLSAERLSYKLKDKLAPKEAELLERLTHTIIEQVQAMQTLVQAFTEYANTPKLEMKPLSVHAFLNPLIDMYQGSNAPWKITRRFSPESLYIEADPNRLRQLFHNLIKNAIEALKETPKAEIIVATEREDDMIKISVCDNGPGLDEAAINWIFEPYATDKPKGTGLGLAVVKKVIEEHHGTIEISPPDEMKSGVCFILRFPEVTQHVDPSV
jgi:PAS domain S-box-containing protein